MSDWIHEIIEGWSWAGAQPTQLVDINAFGNIIFADRNRKYWRITPEELQLIEIADGDKSFTNLKALPDFQTNWQMSKLVTSAKAALGTPKNDECYCLKLPAVLGGDYSIQNIGKITIAELIRTSGYLAEKISDLPDGAKNNNRCYWLTLFRIAS